MDEEDALKWGILYQASEIRTADVWEDYSLFLVNNTRQRGKPKKARTYSITFEKRTVGIEDKRLF